MSRYIVIHAAPLPGIGENSGKQRDKAGNGRYPPDPEEGGKGVGHSALLNGRAYFIERCDADQKQNNTVADQMVKHGWVPQPFSMPPGFFPAAYCVM